VKDPLALAYFGFTDEEYSLLTMLDGVTSLEDMKRRFDTRFAPQSITLAELQQFVGALFQNRLVVSTAPGQGRILWQQGVRRRRLRRLVAASNFLAWRFRGVDPDRFLRALLAWYGWIFSPVAVVAAIVLMLSAATLVVTHWQNFSARLPAFHDFFTPQNAFWLAGVLVTVKVLHELGHGLACRRCGSVCHELGVMLLVFVPCLYCNVSDSCLEPNKWRRAAIGAAGMYVELILAALATWVWWFTEPGLLNQLSLGVMTVCSVSTVVFNGNPFLRYDGYYILADLLEVPNLKQRASSAVQRTLSRWCLGLPTEEDPFLPEKHKMALFAYVVTSAVYRWVVTLAILWFLHKLLEPYRLQVLGDALVVAAIVALVCVPLWRLLRFFYVPGRIHQVKRIRFFASAGLASGLMLAVCVVPLPYRVLAPLELRPQGATAVYVEVPGTLEAVYVRAGQSVKAGDVLAKLRNADLEIELADIVARRDLARVELEHLLTDGQFVDVGLRAGIPEAVESLAALQAQATKKQSELERLVLRAAKAGEVLPTPGVDDEPIDPASLESWRGSPLDAHNVGCHLTEGTLVCLLGSRAALDAHLVVDQGDVQLTAVGQLVDVKLDALPHETLGGVIEEISRLEMEVSSAQLSNKAGGDVATHTDESGRERPIGVMYQARVRLHDAEGVFRIGGRGTARIHTGSRTVAWRCWRWLTRTFRFEW
jgi:putative peptide zinc metalloprotease protein